MSEKRNQPANNFQTQTQIQKQKQAEVQLQEYYVFQDLENVSGIFYETSAVLDYFNNDKNHPMVQLNMNRLITQLNLSNGIHYDTQENAKSTKLYTQLNENKKEAKEMAKAVLNQDEIHEDLWGYLNYYSEYNLTPNTQLRQIKSIPCSIQSNFNEQTLSKVIGSMQQVDDITNGINNGNQYKKLSQDDLKNISMKRKEQAIQKIKKNFCPDWQFQNLIHSTLMYLESDGLLDTRQQKLQIMATIYKKNIDHINELFEKVVTKIENESLKNLFTEYKQFLEQENNILNQLNLGEDFRDNSFKNDIQIFKSFLDKNIEETRLQKFNEFMLNLCQSLEQYVKLIGQELQYTNNYQQLKQLADQILKQIDNRDPSINKDKLFAQLNYILDQVVIKSNFQWILNIHDSLRKHIGQTNYQPNVKLQLSKPFKILLDSLTQSQHNFTIDIEQNNENFNHASSNIAKPNIVNNDKNLGGLLKILFQFNGWHNVLKDIQFYIKSINKEDENQITYELMQLLNKLSHPSFKERITLLIQLLNLEKNVNCLYGLQHYITDQEYIKFIKPIIENPQQKGNK